MKCNNSYFWLLLLVTATIIGSCKHQPDTLFQLLDSKKTGIEFNNDITEYDSLNILNSEFIYNGGGVAIGDLNGDGLQDLYFSGNQVDNKLYLNKGNLQFEDVTERARAQKRPGQWSAGVSFVDLNHDGKLDIYVCNTFVKDPEKRANPFPSRSSRSSRIPASRKTARVLKTLSSPSRTAAAKRESRRKTRTNPIATSRTSEPNMECSSARMMARVRFGARVVWRRRICAVPDGDANGDAYRYTVPRVVRDAPLPSSAPRRLRLARRDR